ncbi:MAG TPA: hypothetical protein VLQ65_15105 [Saliniramus sp.]|nr:hypothetical protein [Saliniramus sp.]
MSMLARFGLATICAVVLAAIAHLAAILIMPWTSERHAAERLLMTTSAENAQLIAGPGVESWLPLPDPAVAVAACAYDLGEGPFRFTASASGLLKSVAFHSRGSGIFFAVTDRAAIGGMLDIVVMTQAQRDIYDALQDSDEDRAVLRVTAPEGAGFAVIRVLAPLPSLTERALQEAQDAGCTIEPLAEPA